MVLQMLRTLIVLVVALFIGPSALARDDGRYAQSPNKKWFEGLTDQNNSVCCDGSDGMRLEDPDWEFNGDSYRVKLDGDWHEVPKQSVVKQKNDRTSFAVVWPITINGKIKIRCFLPGSGA